MRKSRTPGSARGVGGNSRSYRDQRRWMHPEMPMDVPIGGSYPRSLATNYREPIGSNYRYHYRGATK